jgi:rubrerythrin
MSTDDRKSAKPATPPPPPAKKKSDAPKVGSLADLLAIAWQIEADAVERYAMLAEQMETHNNLDLVAIFRDLARAEGIHRDEIKHQATEMKIDVVAHAGQMAKWKRGDSPEEADFGSAHYLMTPWHALQMALAGEKRALAYFAQVVETAKDPKVLEMAKEFVEEEAEHVNLCHRLLRKYPKPEGDAWSEDPDPAISQE